MKHKRTFSFLLVIIMALIVFQSQAQSTGVTLENFHTEVSNGKVLINWSTSASDAGNYFEIEKSTDGENFKTIAYVLGPDPSKDGNQFGYFDRIDQPTRKSYYRIKHVSIEGGLHFSDVRTVEPK